MRVSTDLDPPPQARRVCLFAQLDRPGLGDMVQRNILLGLLRRAYPDAVITLVVGTGLAARFAGLLPAHTYATDVLCCPDPGDTDEGRWRVFREELAERGFDLCLVDPSTKELDASHARAAGIPVRVALPRGGRSAGDVTHPVRVAVSGDLYDYACAFARSLGVDAPPAGQAMPALPRWPEGATELTTARPRVAIHPGGQTHWNRRWPLERYLTLAVRLVAEKGASIYLLGAGGEAVELELLRRGLADRSPGATVVVDIDGSVNRVANLLGEIDLFVGNDSGLGHVAAAVGTPSVIVYGPSGTERLWARVYPHHRGVSLGYRCQTITDDQDGSLWALDGATLTRGCEYACVLAYRGPDGPYPRCLTALDVEAVWSAVATQLASVSAVRMGRLDGN
ncbi:glycosyltransferase family 9 protein [Micromonospora lutea]|uniref:Glycosyltransferase family 9 protein n=1 Tax=Micromonospora lutea TaxID=419825 RepID=A0ABQ4ITG6_9ACTN|nr:glycosyltransferase family 9 protein [Micromonospora lutea]GIJ21066.1 hypothetical protein Vlu01_16900 [Micromonospora lutea]